MVINIDKGIIIPRQMLHGGKYPWRDMEIGDSFFVPGKDFSKMQSQASHTGIKLKKKFMVYRTNEGSRKIAGVRIWRIK